MRVKFIILLFSLFFFSFTYANDNLANYLNNRLKSKDAYTYKEKLKKDSLSDKYKVIDYKVLKRCEDTLIVISHQIQGFHPGFEALEWFYYTPQVYLLSKDEFIHIGFADKSVLFYPHSKKTCPDMLVSYSGNFLGRHYSETGYVKYTFNIEDKKYYPELNHKGEALEWNGSGKLISNSG